MSIFDNIEIRKLLVKMFNEVARISSEKTDYDVVIYEMAKKWEGILKKVYDYSFIEKFITAVFEREYANGEMGSEINIDWNNGINQNGLLNVESCTMSFTNISIEECTYRPQITIYQDSIGGRDVILSNNCVLLHDFVFTQGAANQFSIMTLYFNGLFYSAMCTEWKNVPNT